jgi:hypothetical protein
MDDDDVTLVVVSYGDAVLPGMRPLSDEEWDRGQALLLAPLLPVPRPVAPSTDLGLEAHPAPLPSESEPSSAPATDAAKDASREETSEALPKSVEPSWKNGPNRSASRMKEAQGRHGTWSRAWIVAPWLLAVSLAGNVLQAWHPWTGTVSRHRSPAVSHGGKGPPTPKPPHHAETASNRNRTFRLAESGVTLVLALTPTSCPSNSPVTGIAGWVSERLVAKSGTTVTVASRGGINLRDQPGGEKVTASLIPRGTRMRLGGRPKTGWIPVCLPGSVEA